MEVDTKTEVNESEALLLGDGGDETEQTEFTSGDVELLLGDDDVHAFANESTDAASEASSVSKGAGPGGDLKPGGPNNSKTEQGQPIEGHYTRGGRGGRPFRGRGYGPPPPGYYKCFVCCTEFISRNYLNLHVASKHGNSGLRQKILK